MRACMILLVDTSEAGKTVLALGDRQRVIARRVYRSRFHASDTLLAKVDTLLKKQKTPLQHLAGVVVVLGPGPFSALRGAATIVNSLAFALHIPVAGLKKSAFTNYEDLLKRGRARLTRASRPLLPYYGIPPTIGDESDS